MIEFFKIYVQVIVVAVHPIDREFEYTHVNWAPTRPYGGLQTYSLFLVTLFFFFFFASFNNMCKVALKRWMDSNYRTIAAAGLFCCSMT